MEASKKNKKFFIGKDNATELIVCDCTINKKKTFLRSLLFYQEMGLKTRIICAWPIYYRVSGHPADEDIHPIAPCDELSG